MGGGMRWLLFRVVVPAVLLLGVVLRVNVISALYLLYFLLLVGCSDPWATAAWRRPRRARSVVRASTLTSAAVCLVHAVVQISAAANNPIISSSSEKAWQTFGFFTMTDETKWYDVIRYIAVDFVIAVASYVLQRKLHSPMRTTLNPIYEGDLNEEDVTTEPSRTAKLLATISTEVDKYGLLVLIITLGVSLPSVLSLPYFGVVLSRFVTVAYDDVPISAMGAVDPWPLLLYSGLNMAFLYLYQFDFFRTRINHDVARVVGLVSYSEASDATPDGNPINVHLPAHSVVFVLSLVTFFVHAARCCDRHRENGHPTQAQTRRQSDSSNGESEQLLDVPPEPAQAAPSRAPSLGWRLLYSSVYLGGVLVMVMWALVIPEWQSFVLLLWAFWLFLCTERTFYGHTPYIVAYMLLMVVAAFGYTLVSYFLAKGEAGAGIETSAANTGYQSLRLLMRVVCTGVLAAVKGFWRWRCRHGLDKPPQRLSTPQQRIISDERDPHPINDRTSTSDEDDSSGSDVVAADTPTRFDRALELGKRAVGLTYIVVLTIILFAALEVVTVLNAIYLLLMTLYLVFPQLVASGWILLVIYAELVISIIYLWGFSPFENILSPTGQATFGVSSSGHQHLWHLVRYDLIILILALLQHHASKIFHLKPTSAALYNHPYFRRVWLVITPLAFLLYGTVGTTSLLKLGYLICFFVPLTAHQFSLPATSRALTWISIAYAGIVPYLMYMYQFKGVRQKISAEFDKWGIHNMRDVGLLPQAEETHDQVALFVYLLPALVVFAISVIRGRISGRFADFKAPVTDHQSGESKRSWKVIAYTAFIYCARIFWLESDKAVVLLAFASSLFGCTNLLGFPTVLFVFLALLKSGNLRGFFFALTMFWLEISVLARLAYQLDFVDGTPDRDWAIGLRDCDAAQLTSCQGPCIAMSLCTIVLLAMRKTVTTTEFTTLLWGQRPSSDRRFIDDLHEPHQSQSYLMYTVAVVNNLFELFGLEICLIATAFTAFARLNAEGLIYLIWVPFLVADRSPRWKSFFLAISILVMAQYLSAVGLPPTVCYPYVEESTSLLYQEQTAGLRWLYAPPIRPDVDASSCASNNTLYVNIERAPQSWSQPSAIYADMVLMTLVSMRIAALARRRQRNKNTVGQREEGSPEDVNTVEAGAAEEPRKVGPITVPLVFCFRLTVLLSTLMVMFSRRDVLNVPFFVIFFTLLFRENIFSADDDGKTMVWWERLRKYNQGLLLLHLLWVLPAVLIAWDLNWSGNRSVRLLLSAVGLRFGLDMKLLDDDTRISQWAADGNGMLWDLILFAFAYFHRHLLKSDLNDAVVQEFTRSTQEARGRLEQFLADTRAEEAERERVRDEQLSSIRELLSTIQQRQLDLDEPGEVAMQNLDASTRDHVYGMNLRVLLDPPRPVAPKASGTNEQADEKGDEQTAGEDISETDNKDSEEDKSLLQKVKEFAKAGVRSATASMYLWTAPFRFLYYGGGPPPAGVSTTSSFFTALGWWMLSKSDFVCYILAIAAILNGANLMVIVYAWLILGWGMVQHQMYPSLRFFHALGFYAFGSCLLKYLFRILLKVTYDDVALRNWSSTYGGWLGLTPWTDCSERTTRGACVVENQCHFVEGSCTERYAFQTDLVLDMLIALSIRGHQFVQTRAGLWHQDKPTEAPDTSETQPDPDDSNTTGDDRDSLGVDGSDDEKKPSMLGKVTAALDGFLGAARTDGAEEVDLYLSVFLIQLFSLLVILFGYDSGFSPPAESNTQEAAGWASSGSIAPLFLFYLIFQIAMMVADRALYVYRAHRGKVVYHWIVMIVIHILAFFVVPRYMELMFIKNPVLVLWYLLMIVYLFLSAVQIKAGYPKNVLRNFLYTGDVSQRLSRTPIYAALVFSTPFLYEARSLLDWSCTDTTLTLGEWFKLKDIEKQLFLTQVQRLQEEKEGKKPGELQPRMSKRLGWLFFIVVVFILLFPLILMSALSTSSVANPPTEVSVSLQVFSYEPIYTQSNLPHPVTNAAFNAYTDLSGGRIGGVTPSDVYTVQLGNASQQNWLISEPSLESMRTDIPAKYLNTTNPIIITVVVKFVRGNLDITTGVSPEVTAKNVVQLVGDNATEFIDVLEGRQNSMILNNLFPTFNYVGNGVNADILRKQLPPGEVFQQYADCVLTHVPADPTSDIRGPAGYWVLDQLPLAPGVEEIVPSNGGPVSVMVSTRVIPPSLNFLAGQSIITLYVSVVLVIGRFLKMAFTDLAVKIPYEDMPQVKALQNLVMLVQLTRIAEPADYVLEERLYKLLVSIYRSSEALVMWSSVVEPKKRD